VLFGAVCAIEEERFQSSTKSNCWFCSFQFTRQLVPRSRCSSGNCKMLDLTRSIKRFSVHQRRRGKSKSRNFNRWVGDEWSTNSGSRTPFVWPFGEIGARPGIFNWGQDRSAENRDRRPRAGLGSWGGGGHQTHLPPARKSGGTEIFPSGVLVEPRPPQGFPPFSAFRLASPESWL